MTELHSVLQRKVNDFVAKSKVDSAIIAERLQARTIDDLAIPTRLIQFTDPSVVDAGVVVNVRDNYWPMTGHSAYQMAETIGLPASWIQKTYAGEPFQRAVAAHALNRYMDNYEGRDNRLLFRIVDGRLRGVLSTAYKRMNTREIFLMFLTIAQEMGLAITGAYEGESRDYLEAIDPNIIYINTPNNGTIAYARGAQLRNSDFGAGKLELKTFGLKAICLNGATGKSYIKEVHLGSRLEEGVVFSLETINKETELKALKVRDAMHYMFSEKNRIFEEAQIVKASDTPINLEDEIKVLPRLGVTKEESKIITSIIMKRDPEDGMSGNASKWLLAQAISAAARNQEEERKRELQQIAGNLIYVDEPEIISL